MSDGSDGLDSKDKSNRQSSARPPARPEDVGGKEVIRSRITRFEKSYVFDGVLLLWLWCVPSIFMAGRNDLLIWAVPSTPLEYTFSQRASC